MTEYRKKLSEANSKQIEAIERPSHCIVKAGPGTGKTRTLVLKAAHLLHNEIHPPRGLACITFTKDMANKLVQDLREIDLDSNPNVFIGTTHAFCLVHILLPFAKLYGFEMPDTILVPPGKKQIEIYQKVWTEGRYRISGYQLTERDIDKERLPIRFQKYRRTQLDGVDSPGHISDVEKLLENYELALLEQDFIDFDLQEKWAMKLIEAQPYVRQSIEAKFPWLLVDEYQDMGLPLHRIVKALVSAQDINLKLFAIGDHNQCLYEFRGADPEYLNELCTNEELYGPPIYLEQNYRFSKKVYSVSQIAMPSQKIWIDDEKVALGNAKVVVNGGIQILQEIIERNNVPEDMDYSEIMILTRGWQKAKSVADYIDQKLQIPCFKADKELYEYRKPLLDWLGKLMVFALAGRSTMELRFNELIPFWRELLIANGFPTHEVSSHWYNQQLFDALEKSSSFVSNGRDWLKFLNLNIDLEDKLNSYTHLDDIQEYEKFKQALEPSNPLADYSLQDLQHRIQVGNRVYVGTIHSRKGQEAKVTILAGAEDLQWWSKRYRHYYSTDEQKRLFYVAVTRAENEVYVTHNGKSLLANGLAAKL